MNVMQAGRLIVKKSFQRFVFEAKRFIKKGEMEAARNQLKLEIKEEEIITKYDLKYLFPTSFAFLLQVPNFVMITFGETNKKQIAL